MEKIKLRSGGDRERTAIAARTLVEGRQLLNPLRSNEEIRDFVRQTINGCESDYNVITKLHSILHTMNPEGDGFGMKYKPWKEGGLKTAIEAFQTKEGNCVATTLLFMVMLREAVKIRGSSMKVFFTNVSVDEKEKRVKHTCSAVIIKGKDDGGSPDDVPEEQTNIPFQMNEKFRKKVLEQVGLPEEKDLNLILVDLCYPYLNPWHKVFKLVKDRDMISEFNEMKKK
jgi:hypothetical protein